MEVCYTHLGRLRAADISMDDDKAYIKYLCMYESREKDLPILLYHIDTLDDISYYKEYYTGNIVMLLKAPEKTYMELNPNNIDKKINNIPSLAISMEDIIKIDEDFIKKFYLNEQLNKINDIMAAIDHLTNKTESNISDYLVKVERLISFKCYEKAYLENAIYDLKKGYSYKMKRKSLTKNN